MIDLPDFSDDLMLFGDASPIGLDSLDALQISVALQQHFGVRLQGDRMVRKAYDVRARFGGVCPRGARRMTWLCGAAQPARQTRSALSGSLKP